MCPVRIINNQILSRGLTFEFAFSYSNYLDTPNQKAVFVSKHESLTKAIIHVWLKNKRVKENV
jgi:hypothetical protein